jgi:TPR repeat protein
MNLYFSRPLSLVLIVLASMVSGCAVVDVVKSDIAERQAEPAYASRDYAKAAQAYREMADVGNPYGQYALSLLYLEGKGVRQDQAESLRWMEKAAESGYPAANFAKRRTCRTGFQGSSPCAGGSGDAYPCRSA